MLDYNLVCTKCDKKFPKYSSDFRCTNCHSVLEVVYKYGSERPKVLKKRPLKMDNYKMFLPIQSRIFGPAEGGTPLFELADCSALLGIKSKLWLKDETGNPTRSFKDRGTAVEITKALELGFSHVCCASTGNMALSISTFARLAGLKTTVFISKDANAEKVLKIYKQGAKIIKVDGDFNKASDLAEAFSKRNGLFLCGDYHYRKEGQKTMAFEIMEQLHYKVPDYIIVQVGNGTLFAAMYKGLCEFKRFGLIKKLPKLVAVQSSTCDPLIKAFNNHHEVQYMRPNTYADAIAVGFPTFGFECVNALNKTKGTAISVTDSEIESARKFLDKCAGIKSEPGGAAGFAGLIKLARTSDLNGKTIVSIVTGNNEKWKTG